MVKCNDPQFPNAIGYVTPHCGCVWYSVLYRKCKMSVIRSFTQNSVRIELKHTGLA